MSIISLPFIIFAVVSIFAYNINSSKEWKSRIFAIFNFAFITTYSNSWFSLAPIFAFIILGYILVMLSYVNKTRIIVTGMSVAFIFLFIYLKQYPITHNFPSLGFIYVTTGLSYILFRILHLILDIQSGELKSTKISFIEYFNYVFSFLTFTSGPIQRYQEFSRQISSNEYLSDPDLNVLNVFERITKGFLKVVLFSAIFYSLHNACLTKISEVTGAYSLFSVAILAASASFYTIYLYFNFSGYMDIVIGVGGFMGFTLPENFSAPFGARNFIDFWSKWHITLSEWFKIYMFNPMLKYLIKKNSSVKMLPYWGVISYFATFVVLGAWHGTAYVGFFLGLGVSSNKLYEIIVTKKIGKKKYRLLSKSRKLIFINRGFVFGYLSLSLIFLWQKPEMVLLIARQMGFVNILAFLALMSLGASAFYIASEYLLILCDFISKKGSGLFMTNYFRQTWLSAQLVIIVICLSTNVSFIPEVAYKAF